VEDSAGKSGLLGCSHAARILAAAVASVRSAQSDVLALEAAVRIRLMPGRALRTTSRIAFILCGLISLFTGVPYVMLRGIGLPVQSEWVIFVVAFAVIGVFSVTLGVLPSSWIAKGCKKDPDDQRLFSVLLKVLAIFAGVFYLVAVFAYFSPNRWNLNPQLMLALCPMYLVKMTFDPSPVAIFFLLAPMNAAVYGSLGLTMGYAWLCFHGRRSTQGR
jgi:Ca2+/Na+ antiporter